jgi:2-C-methyl-D-erythritol 4-phosphate cytidylyltransferase
VTVWGVVVAAGSGTRFGKPKHAVELEGRPLFEWARATLLEAGCRGVVVVGDVPGGVAGGPRRRDSVAAGLSELPPEADLVLIHDAARPLASVRLAQRVIVRLRGGDVAAVVPAVAVRDTVKRVEGDVVVETVPRDDLVAVQTPQGFVLADLRAAHAAGDEDATDDAALIERFGGRVVTVPGEPSNLKITYPDDLRLAAALCSPSPS